MQTLLPQTEWHTAYECGWERAPQCECERECVRKCVVATPLECHITRVEHKQPHSHKCSLNSTQLRQKCGAESSIAPPFATHLGYIII